MKKFVIAFLAVFAVFGGVMWIGLEKYINECPVITSKSPVMAYVGTTISIDDLATIEKAMHSEIYIVNGKEYNTNAEVRDGGKTLFVGDYLTEFDVTVHAMGENGETREATVTVVVYVD